MNLSKPTLFLLFVFICVTPSVQQSPWTPLTMTTLTEDAEEGQDLAIDCNYETPFMTAFDYFRTFSWMKDDTLLYDGVRQSYYVGEEKYMVLTEPNGIGINSQLIVKNCSRFDSGRYSCVFDENGAMVSDVLYVRHPPSDEHPECTLKVPTNLTTFSIGSSVEFECLSDGYPFVNLSWYEMTIDGNLSILESGSVTFENYFVRNTIWVDLNYTLNTKTLICMSTMTSQTAFNRRCEIGPIILASELIEKDDEVIMTSTPNMAATTLTYSHDLETSVVWKAEAVKSTTPKNDVTLTSTSHHTTDNLATKTVKNKTEKVEKDDKVLTSVQCECKMDQDYFQFSFFLLLPLLVLSVLFNTFLCVKGHNVKSYPLPLHSEEMQNVAIIGNRRTETIIRNERETASNHYSLGEIYTSIDYANTERTVHRSNDNGYSPHNETDYDFDDDDYFDNDHGYSYTVYDEPPKDDENANFYFDVPNTQQRSSVGLEEGETLTYRYDQPAGANTGANR